MIERLCKTKGCDRQHRNSSGFCNRCMAEQATRALPPEALKRKMRKAKTTQPKGETQ